MSGGNIELGTATPLLSMLMPFIQTHNRFEESTANSGFARKPIFLRSFLQRRLTEQLALLKKVQKFKLSGSRHGLHLLTVRLRLDYTDRNGLACRAVLIYGPDSPQMTEKKWRIQGS